MKSKTATKRVGRPAFDDHLAVYLHVESGRRPQKLSVRAFCALPNSIFGMIGAPQGTVTRGIIKGESLRKRYKEARVLLGLNDPSLVDGQTLKGPEPLSETLEPLIESLIEAAKK
jgi:hypothetical protein